MKRIVLLFLLALTLVAPLCAKKQKVSDSDSYVEIVESEKAPNKKKTSKKKSEDPYDAEKMRGKEERSGLERAFNLNKFQKIDSFSLYIKNTFGKVVHKNAQLIHRAGTDIGGFVCYYDTSSYALQFASEARAKLLTAVEQYFRDFNEKKLDRNGKKTFRVYGQCDAYEDFGIIEGMMKDWSRPRVEFGYMFLKGNPYFCIRVPTHKNLNATSGNEYDRIRETVIEQRYYFTKAQARQLSEFLSDKNIDSLKNAGSISEDDNTTDAYQDEK